MNRSMLAMALLLGGLGTALDPQPQRRRISIEQKPVPRTPTIPEQEVMAAARAKQERKRQLREANKAKSQRK